MSMNSIDLDDRVKLFNLAQALSYASIVLKNSGIASIHTEQMSANGEIYYTNLTPSQMDDMAQDIHDMFDLGELEEEFLYE